MAGQDENASQAGDYSLDERGHGSPVYRPCRFCEAPIVQTRGPKRQPREFCNTAHRAAYREREHQKALALAVEACDNAEAAIGQALAQLGGARQALARFQKKKKQTT